MSEDPKKQAASGGKGAGREPFTEWADTPRPKHPFVPGPVIAEPDPVWKVLPRGFVRAVAGSNEGRAFIQLQNTTDSDVKVQRIFCQIPRGPSRFGIQAGVGAPLLDHPILLKPGESPPIDVTNHLREAMKNGFGKVTGNFDFRIQLVLDPEPPSQPLPLVYTVELKEGAIEKFSTGYSR